MNSNTDSGLYFVYIEILTQIKQTEIRNRKWSFEDWDPLSV